MVSSTDATDYRYRKLAIYYGNTDLATLNTFVEYLYFLSSIKVMYSIKASNCKAIRFHALRSKKGISL